MKRVCLVVQRFGEKIVGGSEQLARCYAELLKPAFEVHVATSCADNHITWHNVFPEGATEEDGVVVHRFPADFERSEYWHRLHDLLLLRPVRAAGAGKRGFAGHMWPAFWHDPEIKQPVIETVSMLPRPVQEEFIRLQGPYCSGLLRFLETQEKEYDHFLFFTYLYPTTYFGARKVPRSKRILVPTLHDEPSAYLPILRETVEDFDQLIFLSSGEQSFAQQICKLRSAGDVIGMPVDVVSSSIDTTAEINSPYIVYCGRLEGMKGSRSLFEYFLEYKKQNSSPLKLVLTGHAAEPIPDSPDIIFLGYVDERRKHALMRDAITFVHPSAFESFSIVLLEAFSARTPALVNAHSIVLAEHCRAANAGLAYGSYEEFGECLSLLLEDPGLREALGENGKRYVQLNYSPEVISRKLKRALDDLD